MELYHSGGPGYAIFPRFISPEDADHIVSFWSSLDASVTHERFFGKKAFSVGCPNYAYGPDQHRNLAYYNFLWNEPQDEMTYTIAFVVRMLRNRVEGRMPFGEIFPYSGHGGGYRITISRGGGTIVPPHQDWIGENFDPRRLQATLFLTERGRDYEGHGFTFRNNQGKDLEFGTDVPIDAGDLVLWRYNNLHSVRDVTTKPGDRGMVRMIFPPETIHPKRAPMVKLTEVVNRGLRGAPGLRRRLGSLYRGLLRR
jgi:hypothetical protein